MIERRSDVELMCLFLATAQAVQGGGAWLMGLLHHETHMK
jgi:hypothetical protein